MNNFPNNKQPPPEFNPNVPPPTIPGQRYYSSLQTFNSPPTEYQSGSSSLISKSFNYSSSPPSYSKSATHSASYFSHPNIPPSSYSNSNFSSDQQSLNTTTFPYIPPPTPPPANLASKVRQTSVPPIQRPYYNYSQNSQSCPYQSTAFQYSNQTSFQNQYHQRHSSSNNTNSENSFTNSSPGYNNTSYPLLKDNEKFSERNVENRSRKSRFETFKKNAEEREWNTNENVTEKKNDFSNHSSFKRQYYSKQIPFNRNIPSTSSRHSSSQSKSIRSTSYSSKDSSSDSENTKFKHYCHASSRSYTRNFSSNENESKFRKHDETERDKLLKSYRSQYCETSEEITKRLAELADNEEKEIWIRSSPAELFYRRTNNGNEVESTPRLDALCKLFEEELVNRATKVKSTLEAYKPPERKRKARLCKHKCKLIMYVYLIFNTILSQNLF